MLNSIRDFFRADALIADEPSALPVELIVAEILQDLIFRRVPQTVKAFREKQKPV